MTFEIDASKVALVNEFKRDEERLLRKIETLINHDLRWSAIARTHFQEGFMALNRAVFQPTRIALPEDSNENAASDEWTGQAAATSLRHS